MRPPIRLDVSQKTFFGFTARQVVLTVLAGGGALLAFLALPQWPLYGRGMLAVLIAGLGLAWAFGEIAGQTPEAWLLELLAFRRRSRYFTHRMMRDGADPRRVIFPSAAPEGAAAEPEAWPAERGVATAPGFVWLSANAIGLAILTGLTLWLVQGGAERLLLVWRGL